MKTRECIEKLRTAKWIRIMALAIVAFIVFSYLHSRGISPVWAAVAIVCFKGFFRFLYKIACLLVAAAILFCILTIQVQISPRGTGLSFRAALFVSHALWK